MGAFNLLSNSRFGGGEKLLKYKQDRMIDAAEGHVSKDEYLAGKGGVCCVMTMRWLAERLGTATAARRIGFGKGEDDGDLGRDTNDIGIAQHSIKMYKVLKNIQAMSGKSESLKTLAKSYGLKLDTTQADKFESLSIVLSDYAGQVESFSDGYYIGFSVHDSKGTPVGTHAIGVMGKAGSCFFFDPNIGEYKINSIPTFIKDYVNCYRESPLHWHLDKAQAFGCLVQA